jgi:hypothetical protein
VTKQGVTMTSFSDFTDNFIVPLLLKPKENLLPSNTAKIVQFHKRMGEDIGCLV